MQRLELKDLKVEASFTIPMRVFVQLRRQDPKRRLEFVGVDTDNTLVYMDKDGEYERF